MCWVKGGILTSAAACYTTRASTGYVSIKKWGKETAKKFNENRICNLQPATEDPLHILLSSIQGGAKKPFVQNLNESETIKCLRHAFPILQGNQLTAVP